jgi:hypothetical protein
MRLGEVVTIRILPASLWHSRQFMQVELAPASAGAAVPPEGSEAAAAAPRWAEAAAVPVVSAGCLAVSAFRADLPLLNSCIRADKTTPPRSTRRRPRVVRRGSLLSCASRSELPSYILDYVLSCRCQVVGMLSTILPAWLTTCYQPSSRLVDDNFDLGSTSSAVKFHEKGSSATGHPCRSVPLGGWFANSRSANFRLPTRVAVSKKGHIEQS